MLMKQDIRLDISLHLLPVASVNTCFSAVSDLKKLKLIFDAT